jgi:4-diphosphocytidyl-2-C-methyl-D-erythritol kinase
MCSALQKGSLEGVCGALLNRFESVILPQHTLAGRLLEALRAGGAVAAGMSGSGPSVYGIFTDRASAEAAAEGLRALGAVAFVTTPHRGREAV